jgi:hypothetical protein
MRDSAAQGASSDAEARRWPQALPETSRVGDEQGRAGTSRRGEGRVGRDGQGDDGVNGNGMSWDELG